MSSQVPYKETQVAVYNYLLSRQKTEPGFNFSLRQKFDKDEGKGLFIGSNQSKYFAFTLWRIPIKHAHATGDLLDYAVRWNKDGSVHVCLHFQMVRSYKGVQGQGNLALADVLKTLPLRWTENKASEASLKLTNWGAKSLHNPAELVAALDKLIGQTAHLIDEAIAQNSLTFGSDWEGRRLNATEFKRMQQHMLKHRSNWLPNILPDHKPAMKQPLNQILYGPPGTGKTYHTALCAVSLLERLTENETKAKYDTREKLRARYDEYQQAGRIQFVTFHQAFSYEDFIEGIKPVLTDDKADTDDTSAAELGYHLADGLFLRASRLATYALHLQHEAQQPATAEADFESLFRDLYTLIAESLDEGKPLTFKTKSGPEVVVTSVADRDKIYFVHKEGKTNHAPYLIRRDRLRKLFETFDTIGDIKNVYKDITDCIGGCNTSGYWAVLNYLKQHGHRRNNVHKIVISSLEEELVQANNDYAEVRAITQGFNYDKLTSADFAQAPRFVLIIDEINRGNVASIFGELITLLEEGKRAGRPERLTARLPYSKADFTVPPNLYLIGTMNTADRSVEALDTALRRRFSFTEMQPNADIIRQQVGTDGVIGEGAAAIDVARILEVLNSRLEQLLDHDHCLGHALLLFDEPTLESLRAAFARNIVPLLQEYFFGDWGKIGLVLGEKFVTALPRTDASRYPLAPFKGYDSAGLHDKPLYRLISSERWDAEAFQSLYPATT